MKYFKHCANVFNKIRSSTYSYGKSRLTLCYLKLIIHSIVYHKFTFKIKPDTSIKHKKLLGFDIAFFSYQQIINLFEEIFIFQVYDFKNSKAAPIIIDCGSNIGLSLLYFKKLYPSCSIIAFEPEHETFQLLHRNIINNNLSDITLFNVAVSDTVEKMNLFKKKQEPGSLNMSLIRTEDRPYNELVSTGKISDYIKTTVDLLKIDVEGAELNILNDLIMNDKINLISNMIIEYHPILTNKSIEEFTSVIKSNNFSCRYEKDQLHPGATESVIYCTNYLH